VLLGKLDAVRRYPVKSLRGEDLEATEIGSNGIPGDRSRALIVRQGSTRVGKTYRGKENDRLHLMTDPDVATASAADRRFDVMVHDEGPFFDDAPISIIVDRWLDSLSAYVGYRVEWQRFRANFFVRAAPDFAYHERSLTGGELRLGNVRLRVRSHIERCVVTTYHPSGAAADPEILRFIALQRANTMGIYCDVISGGAVRVGDALTLLRE
jgi:uncharacterized protein